MTQSGMLNPDLEAGLKIFKTLTQYHKMKLSQCCCDMVVTRFTAVAELLLNPNTSSRILLPLEN